MRRRSRRRDRLPGRPPWPGRSFSGARASAFARAVSIRRARASDGTCGSCHGKSGHRPGHAELSTGSPGIGPDMRNFSREVRASARTCGTFHGESGRPSGHAELFTGSPGVGPGLRSLLREVRASVRACGTFHGESGRPSGHAELFTGVLTPARTDGAFCGECGQRPGPAGSFPAASCRPDLPDGLRHPRLWYGRQILSLRGCCGITSCLSFPGDCP
jgi:hypothetical protein